MAITPPEPEKADAQRREAVRDRSLRLLALTEALARTLSIDEVARAAVRFAVEAVDASGAAVSRISESENLVELICGEGFGPKVMTRRTFPLAAGSPIGDAVRSRSPVFLGSLRARKEAYPDLQRIHEEIGHQGLAVLPMLQQGGVFAALTFYFAHEETFDAETRAFLLAVANQVAIAMERARLYQAEREARAAAEASERRASFLAEAAALLSESLELETTLQRVAALAVPDFADWCAVDLFQPGPSAKRVAVVHQDPQKIALGLEVSRRWPADLSRPTGLGALLRGGPGQVYREIPDELLAASIADPEHLRILRSLGLRSVIQVPIVARGVPLGALTFIYTDESGRRYDDTDLATALHLGRRAGLAIDNAQLFRAEQEARERITRVHQLSEALSLTRSPEELAAVAVHLGTSLLGAKMGAFFRVEDGERLELLTSSGLSEPAVEKLRRREPGTPSPALAAVRTRGPVWIENEDMARALFPASREAVGREGGTRLALPLLVEGRPAAVLVFAHATWRELDSAEKDLSLALADQTAQALLRVKLLENERRALEAARDADRRKDEFLAMLGHELRNPLAPIMTALHLIRLKVEGGIEREIALIDRQVGHLTRLVDDLLDLSRITRGKVKLTREPLELAAVVAKAIELAGPLIEQGRHPLHVDVPHGIHVDGDPVRLAQVFANLLTNAAKYSDSGSLIQITAETGGDRVEVAVRDEGIGIPHDLLPRLFEQFVQGEQSKDRAQGGLGIGLALVRSLVEMHDGSATAESPGPGRGSTFRVVLPLGAERAESHPRREATPVTVARRPMRVLVVDDIEDVRVPLAEALREYGHEVATAEDGPGALREAERFGPEAAIVDIGLPVMDGYELASRLRAADPSIRLFALTGYGQDSDREKSRIAGFEQHFVKPITPDELARTLDEPASAPHRV